MARFNVDSTEVAAAAGQARLTAASIRSEVDAMMSHLTHLQGSWVGAASSAFASCAEQWRMVQATVETNLDSISLSLDNAAHTYDEAEAANQARFSG